MEDLLKEVSTLRFWVAVVFAGMVINLVAAYMKPTLDKLISKISAGYRSRITRASEAENKLVASLVNCSELRDIHRGEAIFERIRSVWFVSFGIGFFILGTNTGMLMGSKGPFFAFSCFGLGAYGLIVSMKYVVSSTEKLNRAQLAYDNANKQSHTDS